MASLHYGSYLHGGFCGCFYVSSVCTGQSDPRGRCFGISGHHSGSLCEAGTVYGIYVPDLQNEGLPLTVENVLKSSRLHKRCGTSFLFLVMLVSIVLHFVFVAVPFYWVRLLGRLLMVPVVAGISFEIIQWAGRTDSKFADIMSKPGLAMQKFTTKEPAADMAEVAIKAVEAVFDWRAYLKEEFDLDIPYETEETENADS